MSIAFGMFSCLLECCNIDGEIEYTGCLSPPPQLVQHKHGHWSTSINCSHLYTYIRTYTVHAYIRILPDNLGCAMHVLHTYVAVEREDRAAQSCAG